MKEEGTLSHDPNSGASKKDHDSETQKLAPSSPGGCGTDASATNSSNRVVNLNVVREEFPKIKGHLMELWRTEICLEVLIESGAAKTLKYIQDFCLLYEEDMPELRTLINMSEKILQKWKNFVMNTIFDDKKDNTCEFVKYKKQKQLFKKTL